MDIIGVLSATLHWVDRHNGFAQALGTVAAAAVASVALIVGLRDTRARTRPAFTAYPRKGEDGEIELVVENIGGSPAKNVRLAFTAEVPKVFGYRNLQHRVPVWVHGMPKIYKGFPLPKGRTLLVTYKGYGYVRHRQRFELNPLSLDNKIAEPLQAAEERRLKWAALYGDRMTTISTLRWGRRKPRFTGDFRHGHSQG